MWRCLAKGKRAYFGMVRRCEVMGIQNVGVRVRLFDALVRPVLLYGCEVWGPAVIQWILEK